MRVELHDTAIGALEALWKADQEGPANLHPHCKQCDIGFPAWWHPYLCTKCLDESPEEMKLWLDGKVGRARDQVGPFPLDPRCGYCRCFFGEFL